MTQNPSVLDQLYSVIQNRKSDNPETSYTAELLSQGMPKIAQKVGEEAVVADGNHPLAGQDLHFGLTLVEIKEAA